jgi:hypothetical protein
MIANNLKQTEHHFHVFSLGNKGSLNYSTVCKDHITISAMGPVLWWTAQFHWCTYINSYLIERWCYIPWTSASTAVADCFGLWGFILLVNLHTLSSCTRKITCALVQYKGNLYNLQEEYSFTFIHLSCLNLLNIHSLW